MKIDLSCIGKFHHFDLARQLYAAGWLEKIFTGYPLWKLKNEGLPMNKINSFPWWQTPYMAQGRFPIENQRFSRWLLRKAVNAHDRHVSRSLLPCDALVGLSGHNLYAGRQAQSLGARWICDHGSSHPIFHAKILADEHRRLGLPFKRASGWVIDRFMAEFEGCDLITIPSTFAERTFLDAGVPPAKLRRVAYGVDLSRFHSVAQPDRDRFDIIFVGGVNVRKGVSYLLEAFRLLRHANKSLTFIGGIDHALLPWVKGIRDSGVFFLGPLPQNELKGYLSRSHVFVLPSIEDGFGMVMAQAMACGCPVIATENTGGPDIFNHGIEGFVVPARDSVVLAERLQQLSADACLRQRMSEAALARVRSIGGWRDYGTAYKAVLNEIIINGRASETV